MFSKFASEVTVRPDDIDMNNHVHNTKYLDYVLAARYEQMKRDYKMSMEDFVESNLNWVVSTINVNYKRALKMGDTALVETQLDSFNGAQCNVNFWIKNKETGKLCADGICVYTQVSLTSGRPVRITEDVIAKYTI